MTFRSEESSGQLQLVEREDIDDDEDLFEAIDKRIFILSTLFSRSFSSFFYFLYRRTKNRYLYLASLRSSF